MIIRQKTEPACLHDFDLLSKILVMKKKREVSENMKDYKLGTQCVQAGYTPGNGEPRQIPIIQSTTFKYDTSEDMGKLFDLEASGYFYTRLQNPTNDMVAAKLAVLEGGTAAMLTSSGQAANFFALFNICESGDHIVSSASIYGGTFNIQPDISDNGQDGHQRNIRFSGLHR